MESHFSSLSRIRKLTASPQLQLRSIWKQSIHSISFFFLSFIFFHSSLNLTSRIDPDWFGKRNHHKKYRKTIIRLLAKCKIYRSRLFHQNSNDSNKRKVRIKESRSDDLSRLSSPRGADAGQLPYQRDSTASNGTLVSTTTDYSLMKIQPGVLLVL